MAYYYKLAKQILPVVTCLGEDSRIKGFLYKGLQICFTSGGANRRFLCSSGATMIVLFMEILPTHRCRYMKSVSPFWKAM